MKDLPLIEEAFRLLEQRPLNPKEPPFVRYTAEIWDFIEQRIPGLGPTWYRDLTQRYRVGGGYFNYPIDPEKEWLGDCTIPRPSMALHYVYGGWPVDLLHTQGWTCFAVGCDGNLWLFDRHAQADPEVHVLELSGWNGNAATTDNGLISPGITLSALLRYGANWAPPPQEGKRKWG